MLAAAVPRRPHAVSDNQPLNEPLLSARAGRGNGEAHRHPESGLIGMMSNNTDFRGSSQNRNAGGADTGEGRSGAGAGAGATNDSFVYHVVRSQRERTETTI